MKMILKTLVVLISIQFFSQLFPLTLTEYKNLQNELSSNFRNVKCLQTLITNADKDLQYLSEKDQKELSEEELKLFHYLSNDLNVEILKIFEKNLSSESFLVHHFRNAVSKTMCYVRNNPKKIALITLTALVPFVLMYKDKIVETGKIVSDSTTTTPEELNETMQSGEAIIEKVVDNAKYYVEVGRKKVAGKYQTISSKLR